MRKRLRKFWDLLRDLLGLYLSELWPAIKTHWGRALFLSTTLGIIIPLILQWANPHPVQQAVMISFIWQIPLWSFGFFVAITLLLTPYSKYQKLLREKEDLAKNYREIWDQKEAIYGAWTTSQSEVGKLQVSRDELQACIGTLQSKIDELTKHSLLLEVDVKAHPSPSGGRRRSQLFIDGDERIPDSSDLTNPVEMRYFLRMAIRLRFDNHDNAPRKVSGVAIALRRETRDGDKAETPITLIEIREEDGPKVTLDEIVIEGARQTSYYWLECQGELKPDWKKLLDRNCFVRVTMLVTKQPAYCVDLDVDWTTPRHTDLPGQFTMRGQGHC
jgi:hypothetical protein